MSQETGSDDQWGADISQHISTPANPSLIDRGRYKPYLFIAEHAANMHDLVMRGKPTEPMSVGGRGLIEAMPSVPTTTPEAHGWDFARPFVEDYSACASLRVAHAA